MSEQLEGRISIGRFHGTQVDNKSIYIDIEDASSTIGFIRVLLTPEALALALTGRGDIDCTFELRGVQNVGKVRETKTIGYPVTGMYPTYEVMRELVADDEVNGWVARLDPDSRTVARREYNAYLAQVVFTRFVDAPVSAETSAE